MVFKYSILKNIPHAVDDDYVWYGNQGRSLKIEYSFVLMRKFSKVYTRVKKLYLFGNYFENLRPKSEEDQTTGQETDHILFPNVEDISGRYQLVFDIIS